MSTKFSRYARNNELDGINGIYRRASNERYREMSTKFSRYARNNELDGINGIYRRASNERLSNVDGRDIVH